jgi:adenine-specific DNA methylase
VIPKECKRLAEVDFPIAVVSKWAAKEKSIRQGHPSTLHLWWARRPLAACRAMLLALLLPDPEDAHCPKEFKKEARELLHRVQGRPGNKDEHLRKGLLKFIGDFANWDLCTNEHYLTVARGLINAAHGEDVPVVVDPFAGGGSIPLEALRLGCEAFASDLNPVACLINKVMLEDIPRYGPALAEKLREVGQEVRATARQELQEFYPLDKDGAQPIAYLWARTVRCEAPNCGAEIPLLRSFWLCRTDKRRRAITYDVISKEGEVPHLSFKIFEPESNRSLQAGTVHNGRATCPICKSTLMRDRLRAQLAQKQFGTADARLIAVVCVRRGEAGRHYRLPRPEDLLAVEHAQQRMREMNQEYLNREIWCLMKRSLEGTREIPDLDQYYTELKFGEISSLPGSDSH